MAGSGSQVSILRVALTIPSFYATLTWGVWLMLYWLRLLAWEPSSPLATTVFIAVLLIFITAFLIALRPYIRWHQQQAQSVASPGHRSTESVSWPYVAALHCA